MTNATVIIVDDDRTFVEAVALFLKKHGYCARTALNGGDGLRLLRECAADVVVLDVHLPDISGLELAKTAQSLPGCPAVILISGDDCPETVERCQQTCAIRFMIKPLVPQELLQVIGQSVRSAR